ncbi:MAG: cation-translocating P-type ATPase [Actinomycetota bacterium]|nr:cation-translocating P-type ATPase [Actinomycetota bacterium]
MEEDVLTGLSEEEAARRLREEGPNLIPSAERRTSTRIFLDILREPMFLLLVGAGSIYLLLGDLREALVLLSFVVLVMALTFVQERRTERALEALRSLSSPRALVIREGRKCRIAGVEVVRGDILLLSEGDRVPADAVVLDCVNLTVDESMLTGEFIPVRKVPCEGEPQMGIPGREGQSSVFAGTLVVGGRGIVRVQATGPHTEMGKIGRALQEISPRPIPIQEETRSMVVRLAFLGVATCLAVFLIYGSTRGDWLKGLLVGITLAMALLPEEFPVVLTVFLALGAWRMSRYHVLTRRIPAVEALGSTTVLCVDKTGTLTQNRMTVTHLVVDDEILRVEDLTGDDLPEKFHELLEFGVLASQKDPFEPMEVAISGMGGRALDGTEHLHLDWSLEREYPLSDELMAMSHVWRSPGGDRYVIAAKGAPEAVMDLCHLGEEERNAVQARIEELSGEGLRLLGVARADFRREELPRDQHDFDFHFLGLIGLEDPLRPGVAESVAECYRAGMRVVMITGDHPGTALRVAERAGIRHDGESVTGPELEGMEEEELRRKIASVNVFSRTVPEQKLRLVCVLQERGEVVAMTGDGVNDAPALKAADIGVAMGGRGADVARESADLVLLDDDFPSLVRAVRCGRRIYENLRKAVSYIIAVHVPIAGMTLIPVFFRLPLVLSPIHIAFLEILIDPSCSLVFEAEPEEEGLMERPPRSRTERLFSRRNLALGFLQGLTALAAVFTVFLIAYLRGMEESEVRALTFASLVLFNVALILVNRSWEKMVWQLRGRKNRVARWIVPGALAILALVLYIPTLRNLFDFALLSPVDLAICLGAGILGVGWFEVFKAAKGRKAASGPDGDDTRRGGESGVER